MFSEKGIGSFDPVGRVLLGTILTNKNIIQAINGRALIPAQPTDRRFLKEMFEYATHKHGADWVSQELSSLIIGSTKVRFRATTSCCVL